MENGDVVDLQNTVFMGEELRRYRKTSPLCKLSPTESPFNTSHKFKSKKRLIEKEIFGNKRLRTQSLSPERRVKSRSLSSSTKTAPTFKRNRSCSSSTTTSTNPYTRNCFLDRIMLSHRQYTEILSTPHSSVNSCNGDKNVNCCYKYKKSYFFKSTYTCSPRIISLAKPSQRLVLSTWQNFGYLRNTSSLLRLENLLYEEPEISLTNARCCFKFKDNKKKKKKIKEQRRAKTKIKQIKWLKTQINETAKEILKFLLTFEVSRDFSLKQLILSEAVLENLGTYLCFPTPISRKTRKTTQRNLLQFCDRLTIWIELIFLILELLPFDESSAFSESEIGDKTNRIDDSEAKMTELLSLILIEEDEGEDDWARHVTRQQSPSSLERLVNLLKKASKDYLEERVEILTINEGVEVTRNSILSEIKLLDRTREEDQAVKEIENLLLDWAYHVDPEEVDLRMEKKIEEVAEILAGVIPNVPQTQLISKQEMAQTFLHGIIEHSENILPQEQIAAMKAMYDKISKDIVINRSTMIASMGGQNLEQGKRRETETNKLDSLKNNESRKHNSESINNEVVLESILNLSRPGKNDQNTFGKDYQKNKTDRRESENTKKSRDQKGGVYGQSESKRDLQDMGKGQGRGSYGQSRAERDLRGKGKEKRGSGYNTSEAKRDLQGISKDQKEGGYRQSGAGRDLQGLGNDQKRGNYRQSEAEKDLQGMGKEQERGSYMQSETGTDYQGKDKQKRGSGYGLSGAKKDLQGIGKSQEGNGYKKSESGRDLQGKGKEKRGSGYGPSGAGKDLLGIDKDQEGGGYGQSGSERDMQGKGKDKKEGDYDRSAAERDLQGIGKKQKGDSYGHSEEGKDLQGMDKDQEKSSYGQSEAGRDLRGKGKEKRGSGYGSSGARKDLQSIGKNQEESAYGQSGSGRDLQGRSKEKRGSGYDTLEAKRELQGISNDQKGGSYGQSEDKRNWQVKDKEKRGSGYDPSEAKRDLQGISKDQKGGGFAQSEAGKDLQGKEKYKKEGGYDHLGDEKDLHGMDKYQNGEKYSHSRAGKDLQGMGKDREGGSYGQSEAERDLQGKGKQKRGSGYGSSGAGKDLQGIGKDQKRSSYGQSEAGRNLQVKGKEKRGSGYDPSEAKRGLQGISEDQEEVGYGQLETGRDLQGKGKEKSGSGYGPSGAEKDLLGISKDQKRSSYGQLETERDLQDMGKDKKGEKYGHSRAGKDLQGMGKDREGGRYGQLEAKRDLQGKDKQKRESGYGPSGVGKDLQGIGKDQEGSGYGQSEAGKNLQDKGKEKRGSGYDQSVAERESEGLEKYQDASDLFGAEKYSSGPRVQSEGQNHKGKYYDESDNLRSEDAALQSIRYMGDTALQVSGESPLARRALGSLHEKDNPIQHLRRNDEHDLQDHLVETSDGSRDLIENVIKGHNASPIVQHSKDGVCCLSLKIWAVWLLEMTYNAHNWTLWIGNVIQQIHEFAAIVQGQVCLPNGRNKILYGEDWNKFVAEIEDHTIAWLQYNRHVRDLTDKIIEKFHDKKVSCCDKCLQDHLIKDVVRAHKTIRALTEALNCAGYWRRCLDEIVQQINKLTYASPKAKVSDDSITGWSYTSLVPEDEYLSSEACFISTQTKIKKSASQCRLKVIYSSRSACPQKCIQRKRH